MICHQAIEKLVYKDLPPNLTIMNNNGTYYDRPTNNTSNNFKQTKNLIVLSIRGLMGTVNTDISIPLYLEDMTYTYM